MFKRKNVNMLFTIFFNTVIVLQLLVSTSQAENFHQHWINYKGEYQIVHYSYHVPPNSGGQKMPIVVYIGGLPIFDGRYAFSNPREWDSSKWHKFAKEHQVVLLGLGFLFMEKHWETRESYQYPNAWAGQALIEILNNLEERLPIKKDELYMFGISAGAQYSIRFAQQNPQLVKAVAAHAAGGYDEPKEFIPTRFLVTVGENDTINYNRLEMAKYFTEFAKKVNIDIDLRIIPEIGHRQTEEQNQMSRDFFAMVMQQAD